MPDGNATVLSATHPSPALAHHSFTRLRHAIEHATHYLPSQGPISIFVHHNTLHAFEDLPFDDAVVVGGSMYGCQPYLSEAKYREALRRGRITLGDLRDALMQDLGEDADDLVSTFGTRYTLRLAMMQMPPHASVPDAELEWLLAESDLLRKFNDELTASRRENIVAQTKTWVMRYRGSNGRETLGDAERKMLATLLKRFGDRDIESWTDATWQSLTLHWLWQVCQRGVEIAKLNPSVDPIPLRHRDVLLAATGEDTDRLVNEVLIRFCGVFLDQGFAGLSLPDRDAGFAKSFARLYVQPMTMMPSWMRSLKPMLRQIIDGKFDSIASIAQSLEALSIDETSYDEYIGETLLALRGWAGMIWQMETSTPFLPKPAPADSLFQYLAIRLLLERAAIADAGQRRFQTTDVDAIHTRAIEHVRGSRTSSTQQRTYTVFQLAQTGGWIPENLLTMTPPQWHRLISEIESFSALDRRRILHVAYERKYRSEALDAISIHCQTRRDVIIEKSKRKTPPAFTTVFCIDDREESMRRHLEEVDPDCNTASAAGFYAVAMNYQGADHAHYRPLCPNVITPDHYVREEPLFSSAKESEKRAERRRRIGTLTHTVHASSRTMIGGWVTGVFGAVATFPLVARIMAPRLTSQIREAVGSIVRPPATELHLERITERPGQDFDSLGYSLPEMADIVVRILQDIGLVENFPPVVVFFGHGSSSLNNPHESAYNCGACSGGRGGPNARAFAWMANDARVRALVTEKGITLPDDVRFVGAYHNTCNDAVEYYDLDGLPRSHRVLFRRIETSIDEARARNAHERSRRFESAPLDLSIKAAFEHVEQRAKISRRLVPNTTTPPTRWFASDAATGREVFSWTDVALSYRTTPRLTTTRPRFWLESLPPRFPYVRASVWNTTFRPSTTKAMAADRNCRTTSRRWSA